MLYINTSSWHFRVYGHWTERWANKPPATINLCHYMRAVLIYVPGIWLGIAILSLITGAALLITLPIWGPCWLIARKTEWFERLGVWLNAHEDSVMKGFLFGILGVVAVCMIALFIDLTLEVWWKGLMVFGSIVGGVLLGIALLVLIGELYDNRQAKKDDERWAEAYGAKEEKPPSRGAPSLVWQWIKAKKKKICPILQPQGKENSHEATP